MPAKLRDQMLNDPAFTRLGWGTDDPPTPDQDEPSDRAEPTSESNSNDTTEPTADRPAPDQPVNLTERVAAHDRAWDTQEASLPPGALPEAAKSLSPEVIKAMDRDVRRVLEYQGAAEYIAANKDDRTWLDAVTDATPQVQRIFVAIDQGNGHAHIRHGPMGNDQLYADRVARLEDPAQTDPDKRALSIDGLDEDRMHYCAHISARIHDAEAFVAAYAGAVKRPEVREVLDSPWTAGTVPRPVSVPIADLLGRDGHEWCSGYRLVGEPSEAKRARREWVKARSEGQDLSGRPEPSVERIPTFEGGDIVVAFASNAADRSYEITSMFPDPPEQ
ncbi:hypothetical protein ACXJJ3_12515 [Kribbella sp. WER1]